jgi:hypothetical protein
MNISAENLTINSGGLIDALAKGYTAENGPGGAPSGGTSGGTYGGQGVSTISPYGSTVAPFSIGSGGNGGSGGGAIRFTISGNFTNNGTIRATANNTGGSGSGGSIYVAMTGGSSTWSGNGSISANGGTSSASGGGGGGRVAVTGYVTDTHSGTTTAYGGPGGGSNQFTSAAGTVYTKSASQTNGTLLIDNNNIAAASPKTTGTNETTLTVDVYTVQGRAIHKIASGESITVASGGTQTLATNSSINNQGSLTATGATSSITGSYIADGTNSFGNVTFNSGAAVTHTANTTTETFRAVISAQSLTVASGASINTNNLGYQGGTSGAGSGPGAGGGGVSSSSAGGGGYGGAGGAGTGGGTPGTGGTTYGSSTNPTNIGSGGGKGSASGANGGAGGGAIILTVTGAVSIEGSVTANGQNGTSASFGGGGGSGGTVKISADSLSGSGTITANGGVGQGTTQAGGCGGGGRIGIIISGSNTFSGTKTASGATGDCTNSGGDGTLYAGADAPGSFTAGTKTATSIDWTWIDQSTTETSFKLHDNSHNEITSVNSTTTAGTGTGYNFNETSLSVNTSYTRHVHAHDGTNEGPASGSATAYTLANTPGTPTLSGVTATGITVTINQNSNPTNTEYAIFESNSGGYVQTNGTLSGTTVWQSYANWGGASGKAVTGLSVNTQYSFQVKARNGNNDETSLSSAASNYTLANTPGTPTLSTITPSSITVTISTSSNPAATEFALFESTTNKYVQSDGTLNTGTVWQSYTTWGGASGKAVTGLSVNTQYSFQVKARNGDNVETTLSSSATNYTQANTPGTPTLSSITQTSVKVTIVPNGNSASTEFAIFESGTNKYVQNDGTLNTTTVWQTYTTWGGASGQTVSGLSQNNSYSFAVKARNGDNVETSLSSSASTVTLANTPGAPTLSNVNGTSITVTVAVNSNPASTEFAIFESGTGKWVQTNGTLNTTTVWQTFTNWGGSGGGVVSGLSPSTSYTFAVKARNSASVETSLSSSASATTDPLPATPTVNQVAGTSTTSITWSWTDQSTTEVDFRLHDASHNLIATIASTTTVSTGVTYSYTESGLSPNVSYTRHIHSFDTAESDASGNMVSSTLANTPGVPQAPEPDVTSVRIVINQNNNPSDTEYAIYESHTNKYVPSNASLAQTTSSSHYLSFIPTAHAQSDDNWQTFSDWGGNDGVTINGLQPASPYEFSVKARNNNGVETTLSTAFSLETDAAIPASPEVVGIGDTSVRIRINRNGNPDTVQYSIIEEHADKYVQSDGSLNTEQIWKSYSGWGGDDGVVVTGLTPGKEYFFRVFARTPGGVITEPCPVVVVKTRVIPGTPTPRPKGVPFKKKEDESSVGGPGGGLLEHTAIPTPEPTPRPPWSPYIGKLEDIILNIAGGAQQTFCQLARLMGTPCPSSIVKKLHWDHIGNGQGYIFGPGFIEEEKKRGTYTPRDQDEIEFGIGYEEIKDPSYVIKCHSHIVVELKENEYIDDKFYRHPCVYVVELKANGKIVGIANNVQVTDVAFGDVKDLIDQQTRVAGFSAYLGGTTITAIALGSLTGLFSLISSGATTSSALASFLSNLSTYYNQIQLFLFSWRKKQRKGGRIYIALTNQPLGGARILLYQEKNYQRIIDQTISDKNGQFGFLADPGAYQIRVTRAGYTFPSKLEGDAYHGQTFTMHESGIVQLEIPLDPRAPKRTILRRLEAGLHKLQLMRRPLLVIGSSVALFSLVQGVTLVNLIFFAYYTYLWVEEVRKTRELRHILKVQNAKNDPLPFAIVRLRRHDGTIAFAKVADALGRVFVLAPKGSYQLEVVSQARSGDKANIYSQPLELPSGVLTRPLSITFTNKS